jgi:UDP-N-acetylmuramoyl-L-alanyl-D-glutamate--2,6-diaminopimelate ligase
MNISSDSIVAALREAGLFREVVGTLPTEFFAVCSDTRAVVPGALFVAGKGAVRDGHEFNDQAFERGATAAIVSEPDEKHAPAIVVNNSRKAAAVAAASAYGWPAKKLRFIGVTGTNGKTTTVSIIRHLLNSPDNPVASVGTLGVLVGEGHPLPGGEGLTTPGPVELQRLLRQLVDIGVKTVAMEVSSHSLDQHRVEGVTFDAAVYTNLTRDHLDYHRTMRAYRDAKARLFRWPGLKWAVVNIDDAFGAALAEQSCKRGIPVLAYGFSRSVPAVLKGRKLPRLAGRNLTLTPDGVSFDFVSPWGGGRIESALIGHFNACNLLAVLGVALVSGVSLERAARAIAKVKPVAGRTERYGGGRRPLVIIDYAHTPDALENVLRTLRDLIGTAALTSSGRKRTVEMAASGGRLICVFGCGGDRDRGKRPLMGRIASRLADEIVLTSDNPRNENPHAIIDDVLAGVKGQCIVVENRTRAIHAAIDAAAPGDIVLVAGKGHEQYQEIAGVKHPYSDAAVVREALGEPVA